MPSALEGARRSTPPAELVSRHDFGCPARPITAWLDEAKAEKVVTIDIRGKSSIGDYMVIASGRSDRHVGAIAEQLQHKLKDAGLRPRPHRRSAAVRLGADRCRRHHRARVPARGARVLQPRKDVVGRAPERTAHTTSRTTSPADAGHLALRQPSAVPMRLIVATVGRLKDGPERDLLERYRALRGAGQAAGAGPVGWHEIGESRAADAAKRSRRKASRC